jgi:hypothetical protein
MKPIDYIAPLIFDSSFYKNLMLNYFQKKLVEFFFGSKVS